MWLYLRQGSGRRCNLTGQLLGVSPTYKVVKEHVADDKKLHTTIFKPFTDLACVNSSTDSSSGLGKGLRSSVRGGLG